MRRAYFFAPPLIAVIMVLCQVIGSPMVAAQNVIPACREFNVVENFNMPKYLGRWYGYKNLNKQDIKCNTIDYERALMDQDGDNMIMFYGMFNAMNPKKEKITEGGYFYSTDGEDEYLPGRFDTANNFNQLKSFYDIIDTDYKTYSIAYDCKPMKDGSGMMENFWIMMRDRQPTQADRERVDKLIEEKLPKLSFQKVDQTDC